MANKTEQSKSGMTPSRRRLFQTPAPELPPGWKEYRDRSTDQVYYANKSSGESSWTRPKLTKSDKKQLAELKRKEQSSQRVKVERTSSNITKASESPSSKVDIEYTKQVQAVEKRTVSFSSKHEVRTYKVEPAERALKKSPSKKRSKGNNGGIDGPSKNIKSSKKRSKHTRETTGHQTMMSKRHHKKSGSATDNKAVFKPFWKRRAEKSTTATTRAPTAEQAADTSILRAPSSLLGIRNKSLKKKATVVVKKKEESDPPVITTVCKVASLPLPVSNSGDIVETSVTRMSATTSSSNSSSEKVTSSAAASSEGHGSIEDAPSEQDKSAGQDKVSLAPPSKATSKIASLFKPTPVPSSNKTWPIQSKKSKKEDGPVDSSKRKSEPHLPAAATTTTEESTESKQDTTENEREATSSRGITIVSDKIKALTASLLLGSTQEKETAAPSEKSSQEVCTPSRKVKKADNGSPASSTLASSLPLSELMFDKDLEVDSDSVKVDEAKNAATVAEEVKTEVNTAPSKISIVNSFFKNNRSKDSKEEEAAIKESSTPVAVVPEPVVVPAVIVTPSKPEVVSVDSTPKEEPAITKETTDGDTLTTGSSASGIEAEPLESGWVVEDDDDLGDDHIIEIRESRCGDCGCSKQIHDTLLCVGGLVFKVLGKPNDDLRATMENAGDFFAEEDSLDGSEY
ncbi:hypothetical protein ACHAXN_009951 [Cyclotella atomus]